MQVIEYKEQSVWAFLTEAEMNSWGAEDWQLCAVIEDRGDPVRYVWSRPKPRATDELRPGEIVRGIPIPASSSPVAAFSGVKGTQGTRILAEGLDALRSLAHGLLDLHDALRGLVESAQP